MCRSTNVLPGLGVFCNGGRVDKYCGVGMVLAIDVGGAGFDFRYSREDSSESTALVHTTVVCFGLRLCVMCKMCILVWNGIAGRGRKDGMGEQIYIYVKWNDWVCNAMIHKGGTICPPPP